jgi:hypothetical protein
LVSIGRFEIEGIARLSADKRWVLSFGLSWNVMAPLIISMLLIEKRNGLAGGSGL